MKTMFKLALAATAAMVAVPGQAAVITAGATGVAPTAGVPTGQGTQLASQSTSGQALTFAAIFNQAVYRNAAGTLDFYYQVIRTGAGSTGADQEIRSFTVSDFGSVTVDGYASGPDPDGASLFVPVNNPNLANGTASGSTTTFGRSPSGSVVTTEFGANGLTGTENSATYIFRTSATNFNGFGTFGIIDGSTLQGMTYAPTAAVPEPSTWAMMLIGFGAVGFGMRRRRSSGSTRMQLA